MIIAIIFFSSILAVGIAYYLRWRAVRTAYIWFFLLFICLLEWLLFALIPLERINPLIIEPWFRIGTIPINLQFQVSSQNWPIAFSILAFILAFFFTSIARLDIRRDLWLWTIELLFGAFLLLSVLAYDLWTVIILWTALDLMDIFIKLVVIKTIDRQSLLRSVTTRFFGSLLLILNTASISRLGINPGLESLKSIDRNIFIIAALLHSGIFPFSQSSKETTHGSTENILETSLRLFIFTASLSLIIYLPSPENLFLINIGILILLFIFMGYFGYLWMMKKGSSVDISFALLLAACFSCFLYFEGSNQALSYWLPAFLFPCLFFSIYTHRSRSTIIFPALMIVLVSGLPFTLNTFGSRGLFSHGLSVADISLVIPLVLFLTGFFIRGKMKGGDFHLMESWYQAVYLIGLFLPILSAGIISIKYLDNSQNEFQYWWAGLLVVIGVLGITMLINRKGKKSTSIERSIPYDVSKFLKFLSFDWFFSFGQIIESRLSRIVTGFSGLLEGAGGILWALVFLLLILTVFR